MAAHNHMICFN